MKGFPKTIKTGQDIEHCLTMVQAGELAAADLLGAIDSIERLAYLRCPVVSTNETRKKVTIRYCHEAVPGQAGNCNITAVAHQPDPDGEDNSPAFTQLTISAALPQNETEILIPVGENPFESIGITPARIAKIREVLS